MLLLLLQFLYDFLTIKNANHNDIFKLKENKLLIYKKINDFLSFCINDDNKTIENSNDKINNILNDYEKKKKNQNFKEHSAYTASYRNKFDEIQPINMNDIKINLSNIIKKGYEIKTSFISNDKIHDTENVSFNQNEKKVIKDSSIIIDMNENKF